MSNLESQPAELACAPGTAAAGTQPGDVEILQPRLVPLGGPRAMTVRRTLPQRQRSLIGGWCFADHYGPGCRCHAASSTVCWSTPAR